MSVFILTLTILFLAMVGLAVGVLFGRAPLRGSCGGNAIIQMCAVCKNTRDIKLGDEKDNAP